MTDHPPDSLLEMDRAIDQVVHRFEQQLRRGDVTRIEDVAVQHAALGSRLVRELLLIEIEYRRSQQQSIDWDAYARRFPDEVAGLRAAETLVAPPPVGDTSRNSVPDSVADVPSIVPSDVKPANEPPLAPLELSDYVLESRLGRGGQGEVYLARQRSLGRRVAVKLLLQTAGGDPQSVTRFVREARTLAQTQHPHIVTIHGIGRSPNGELFLVMEYVEGDDLAKQIAARKVL